MMDKFVDEKQRDAFADITGAAACSVVGPLIVDMGIGIAPMGLTSIGKNIVVFGGLFLGAKTVTDLVRPRIMALIESELKGLTSFELDVVRLAVPFGVGMGLDILTGASTMTALRVGASVAISSAVADYVYKNAQVKMRYAPGPGLKKK